MYALLLFCSLAADPGRESALSIADAVKALNQVSFGYRRVLDYTEPKYHHELSAEMFVDFSAKSAPLYAKFHARGKSLGSGSGWTSVFNGQVLFIQTDGRPADSILKPKAGDFEPTYVMKNSILGLSKNLESLIADAGQGIALTEANQIRFTLTKKELGPIKLVDAGYDPTYTIDFDSKTKLPTKIVQILANGTDTIETTFTKWNLNPTPPEAKDWAPKGS